MGKEIEGLKSYDNGPKSKARQGRWTQNEDNGPGSPLTRHRLRLVPTEPVRRVVVAAVLGPRSRWQVSSCL